MSRYGISDGNIQQHTISLLYNIIFIYYIRDRSKEMKVRYIMTKYSILVACMALLNIIVLYNLFDMSVNKAEAASPTSCKNICEQQLVDLTMTAEGLLIRLKELLGEDKFSKHVEDIKTIIGDTGIGESMMSQFTKRVSSSEVVLRFSCPDTYKGSTYGYPFYKTGFVREDCSSRVKLSESTTMILDRPQASNKQLLSMIAYAARIFTSVIVLLEDHMNPSFETFTNIQDKNKVEILRKDNNTNLGFFLSEAAQKVTSTFTLVAPFLSRFDNNTDIERLIHVLELSKGDIIGGSVKNDVSGEWDRGCYQSSLKLYTLNYKKGYTKSRHECLYCHYLVSPFLIRTQQLDVIPFNFDLPSSVYRDYFLQMQMNSKAILACPDVMFYTKPPVHMTEIEDMSAFADIWNIKRITDERNKLHWFGCRHKKTPCKRALNKPAPPCCRANLADAIKFIHDQCIQNAIRCEVVDGTLMGAVKFNNILPWERDADIAVLSADFNKFIKLKPVFEKKGYQMEVDTEAKCCKDGVMTGGEMVILAHGWHIDVFGQHILTTSADDVKTKVSFADAWVYGPENPGQSIRNRYGHEIYKHAEHWMSTNKKSSWEDYTAGKFQKCELENDQTCLDQFEADGDVQFEGLL